MEACEAGSDEWGYQQETNSETSRTISRGSKPKSLDEWIDSNFTPTVIQAELDEITNLFKNSWLTDADGYGFSKAVDGDMIKSYYVTMMHCRMQLHRCRPMQ